MPRQPRLEIPGALYHVTNRGLERRNIVRCDNDRWSWFRLLDRVATRCHWRIFAYVLLDNHFHLYLRLTERNLSLGMHDFEGGYATLFNKNHDRNGPLFESRFHTVIVENESHSVELTRYLHLNPVRAGVIEEPLQYPWSSYRYYLSPRGAPHWLDWAAVLSEFGLRESAARVAYKRFVDAGISALVTNPLAKAVEGWILGGEAFAQRCRELTAGETSRPNPRVSLDEIIATVAERFGVSRQAVEQRGRHGNRARDAAILFSRELLSESLETLAKRFGGVSRSAVTETARRARDRLQYDESFRSVVEQIRRQL